MIPQRKSAYSYRKAMLRQGSAEEARRPNRGEPEASGEGGFHVFKNKVQENLVGFLHVIGSG